jgi:CheY-like chemotaxis protein
MEVKRILIVDDHFDTLKFLRSLLELADSRYEVIAVRSGEEAGLELRRHFDLLITDIRLPGIDGIEVARRAQKRTPDMPIILISGFPKELGQVEALDFEIFCYFRKPLEADAMLAAVHTAIFGEPPPVAEEIIEETIVEETIEELVVETPISPEVIERLEQLRQNTGAEQLVLGSITGQVAAQAGILSLDLPPLCQTLAENLRTSFALADQLGTTGHQTIQYQTSNLYDVYTANVGEYHFITMFFDARAKRGRIGTVWVFVQRATKDLEPLLANARVQMVERTVKKKLTTTTQSAPAVQEIVAKLAEEMPSAPVAVSEAPRRRGMATRQATPSAAPPPAPKVVIYEPPPPLALDPVRDEDLQKLEALLAEDDDAPADLFWEAIPGTAEAETALLGGVRLDEALQQGIITSETGSPLAEALAEEPPNGLAEADNWAFLLQAAENKPEITLDLGPADDDLDLSGLAQVASAPPPSAPTLDLGEALDDDDLDLSGMPGLPSPTASTAAPAPAEPTFALELEPFDDDDFDLTGMPGLPVDGDPAPAKAKGKGKGKKETKTAPPPIQPPLELEEADDFDLSGMPGLPAPEEPSAADPKIQAEIDAFWNALVSGDTSKSTTGDGRSVDDALAQGVEMDEQLSQAAEGSLLGMDGLGELDDEAADAFWDTAATSSAPANIMKGMTLEEAQKQGLIPTDLGRN